MVGAKYWALQGRWRFEVLGLHSECSCEIPLRRAHIYILAGIPPYLTHRRQALGLFVEFITYLVRFNRYGRIWIWSIPIHLVSIGLDFLRIFSALFESLNPIDLYNGPSKNLTRSSKIMLRYAR